MNVPIQNLAFRAITPHDTPQFFDLIDRNRSFLTDYFPRTIATITSEEACGDYMTQKMKEAAEKEGFGFVLADVTGKLQGYISIKNIDWTVPKCELAYFIDNGHKDKGIMTKALVEVVAYCFDTLLMNKVYLITATDNYASRKLAEKTGFEVEGLLRDNFKLASGALTDMVYYGILAGKR